MMNVREKYPIVAVALALALAGCGNAYSTGSGGSAAQAVPAAPAAIPAAAARIGGEYKGTVRDTKLGKGTFVMQVVNSGTSYGGAIVETFGKKTVNGIVSVSLVSGELGGYTVAQLTAPCSFTLQAKFDLKTDGLDGSYNAANGCSGEKGTFKALESCYYQGSGAAADLRPHPGGAKPC